MKFNENFFNAETSVKSETNKRKSCVETEKPESRSTRGSSAKKLAVEKDQSALNGDSPKGNFTYLTHPLRLCLVQMIHLIMCHELPGSLSKLSQTSTRLRQLVPHRYFATSCKENNTRSILVFISLISSVLPTWCNRQLNVQI